MKQTDSKTINYKHDTDSTWCVQDQPSAKLSNMGTQGMTDTELIAVLLQGMPHATILARTLFKKANNDLPTLATFNLNRLVNIDGLTPKKAATLVAAFALGRRSQAAPKDKIPVRSSQTVYDLFRPTMADLQHEEFWLITMNRANRILGKHKISQGGLSGTVIDTRIILKKSLDDLAASIIVCHNHPSGNIQPSDADINITKKLKSAAEVMEIQTLDHVIVANGGYYSFADEGLI